MNPFERPGIFPPWSGQVSPPTDPCMIRGAGDGSAASVAPAAHTLKPNPRARDIEIARQRGGWLIAGLTGVMLWLIGAAAAVTIIKALQSCME